MLDLNAVEEKKKNATKRLLWSHQSVLFSYGCEAHEQKIERHHVSTGVLQGKKNSGQAGCRLQKVTTCIRRTISKVERLLIAARVRLELFSRDFEIFRYLQIRANIWTACPLRGCAKSNRPVPTSSHAVLQFERSRSPK